MTFRLPGNAVASIAGMMSAVVLVSACASGSTPPEAVNSGVLSSALATPTPGVDNLDEIAKQRVQYYVGQDADPDQNWADFYLPAGPQKKDSIPLVVLVHGGAWRLPAGADIFDDLAMDIAARGFAVYNVEYRRVGAGGGWPATFHDVARALDHIVTLDREYPQITTGDELVVGHSAGAQLATWGGTRHKLHDGEVGNKPAFVPTRVVSLAGPLDMKQAVRDGDDRIVAALGGTPEQRPDRYSAIDPIENLDKDIPVAAVHGTNDKVVFPHNSQRYVAELNSIGGHGRLLLFDGHDHTSIVKRGSDAYDQILDVIQEFADAPIRKIKEG